MPKAIIHGPDVIRYLSDIVWNPTSPDMGFRMQQIVEGRLRSLNLTGENSFLANIHEQKEIGIRQGLNCTVQGRKCAVGIGEQACQ